MSTEVLTYESNGKLHAVRPGEIVIEIDNEHKSVKKVKVVDDFDPFNPMKTRTVSKEVIAGNRHELFEPYTSRENGTNTIRSRIVFEREEYLTPERARRGIEYAPGERIHVDLVNRIGRITDGLGDPENEDLYLRLIDASKNLPRKFPLQPSEPIEVDLSNDERFWEWIFAMRKICNGDADHNSGPPQHPGCALEGPRRCRPVQNVDQLPSWDDCIRSLKIKIPFHGTPEYMKAWDEERKERDPDYSRAQGNSVVLTPYIAGIPREEELVGA